MQNLQSQYDQLKQRMQHLNAGAVKRNNTSGVKGVEVAATGDGSQAHYGAFPGGQAASKAQYAALPGAGSRTSIDVVAEEIFDESFLTQCDHAMNMQLTRTKDGANDAIRIQELAGMVKSLRRCLKLYTEKVQQYRSEIDTKIEPFKLACDTEVKRQHAEVAAAQAETAQMVAAHKTERAGLHAELQSQKAEVSQLSRELEHVVAERDRLRQAVQQGEHRCHQLGLQLEDAKATKEQAALAANVQRSELERQLRESLDAVSRQQQALQDMSQAQEQKVRELTGSSEHLLAENRALNQSVEQLQAELAEAAAGRTQAQAQLARVAEQQGSQARKLAAAEDSRQQLEMDLQASRRQQEDAVARLCSSEHEVGELRQRADALEASVQDSRAEVGQLQSQLQASQAERQQMQAAAAREAQEHCALEARAAELQAQLQRSLQQQSSFEQEAEEAVQALASARSELDEERQAHQEVRDHAEEIQSKLTQLENELEALQDIVGCGDQREMLDRLVHKVATLEGALAEAERTRRELHNELVELRGNVRVFCRLRPAATSVVEVQGEQGLRLHSEGRSHAFRFDRVFGQSSDQETVFGQVSDLVQSALDGFKVCLFSYGQTGAGKTYTMLGPPGAGAASQGIIPRAIKKLLSTATRQEEQGWRFDMHAYFVEIYNEMLRDLLADGAKRGAASRITDANPIRHDPNGGHTSVAGASVFQVDSQETAEALIDRAARARSVDATAMNSESSRSHSVFTLNITASSEQQGVKLLGSLSLVDLAGSERLDRSRAEGQRQKETCAINKSLSCLGDVFAALSSKASHIPYRNSKLTHLLQPSLGGSGKTLMLVSLNPEPASAAETLCSLRFACKVNQCEAPGGAARRLVAPLGAASGGVFAAGSDSSSSVSLGQKRKSLHAAASGRHAKLGRFD